MRAAVIVHLLVTITVIISAPSLFDRGSSYEVVMTLLNPAAVVHLVACNAHLVCVLVCSEFEAWWCKQSWAGVT